MTSWNYTALGIAAILLVFLVWKEAGRADRSRLAARIIATALAVTGLVCLMLPLTYKRSYSICSGGKAGMLLTEGYDADSVRRFLEKTPELDRGALFIAEGAEPPAGIRVRAATEMGTTEMAAAGMGAARMSSTGMTVPAVSVPASLHVFGYGLTRAGWTALSPPPLILHPPVAETGIVSVSWPRSLMQGEPLKIQGSFALAPNGPVPGRPGSNAQPRPPQLLLSGMGILLDSIRLTPGAGQDIDPQDKNGRNGERRDSSRLCFTVSTIPAFTGRALYSLSLLVGSDTLERETIPVEVRSPAPLKILLLASSPEFENSFLVNWLVANGHGVAVRTTISKAKYEKAFLNMQELSLDRISPGLLDQFTVVMVDEATLQQIPAAELSTLRRQVSERGLGLIIKADSSVRDGAAPLFYRDLFPLAIAKDSTQQLYIKERPGTHALLRDSLARVLVNSSLYGSGKLVYTALKNTYSFALSGRKKEYAALWSQILRHTAREADPAGSWQFAPALPRVNEPVQALLRTSRTGLSQGAFGSRVVYLDQHSQLPFFRTGSFWPEENGWQVAHSGQGDSCWWYVWPARDWQLQRRQQRLTETKAYIRAFRQPALESASSQSGGRALPALKTISSLAAAAGPNRVPVNQGCFFGLFFLGCLFLWVERKI